MTGEAPAHPREAFDFLHGSWTVAHRKRLQVLRGDDAWCEFGGSMVCRPILAGWGNRDDNLLAHPEGAFAALTLRVFDPAAEVWRIFWVDCRRGRPDPPVVGRFVDGTGCFEGDDEVGGIPIRVRFAWIPQGPDHARWEQSFSADGGVEWERNWIMDFTRQTDLLVTP